MLVGEDFTNLWVSKSVSVEDAAMAHYMAETLTGDPLSILIMTEGENEIEGIIRQCDTVVYIKDNDDNNASPEAGAFENEEETIEKINNPAVSESLAWLAGMKLGSDTGKPAGIITVFMTSFSSFIIVSLN